METQNPVDQQYLENQVLAPKSEPHIVYVTWPDDVMYPHLWPVLAEIAGRQDRMVTLVTAVVADTMEFCEKMQVLVVPSIFLFRRGNLEATLSGFLPIDRLAELVGDLTKPTTVEEMAETIERARQAIAEGKSGPEIADILRPGLSDE